MRRPEPKRPSIFAHETAIQELAREILPGMGLSRVGQSRDWVLDLGHAVVVLTFRSKKPIESLKIARKAFAAAGVAFLWNERSSFATTMELSSSAKPIVFYDDEDWQAVAANVLDQAVGLIDEAKREFSTIEATAGYLASHEAAGFYFLLDRAIALGLTGSADAAGAFERVAAFESESGWVEAEKERAAGLAALLSTPDAFAQAVDETIATSRRNLRLAT